MPDFYSGATDQLGCFTEGFLLRRLQSTVGLATASPVLGQPVAGYILAAADLATASPALAAATLGQRHALAASNLSVASPIVGSFGAQAIALVVASPVLDAPALGQRHALVASNLAVASPAFGVAALPTGLTAPAYAVSAPQLGYRGDHTPLRSGGLRVGIEDEPGDMRGARWGKHQRRWPP